MTGGLRLKPSEGPCNRSRIDQFCKQSPLDDARAHCIVVGEMIGIFDANVFFLCQYDVTAPRPTPFTIKLPNAPAKTDFIQYQQQHIQPHSTTVRLNFITLPSQVTHKRKFPFVVALCGNFNFTSMLHMQSTRHEHHN